MSSLLIPVAFKDKAILENIPEHNIHYSTVCET